MAIQKRRTDEIRQFILDNVGEHSSDIVHLTVNHFGHSRQAVAKYIRAMTKEGLLEAEGNTRARRYSLQNLTDQRFYFQVSLELEEDVIWRESLLPLIRDIQRNILDICQHGFTEMMNNVIDHSEAKRCFIRLTLNAKNIEIWVSDEGVGIFNKIMRDHDLHDPRQALLELTKGKLTSTPDKHSGEGIFFTSRMFDEFVIISDILYFRRSNTKEDWFIESENRDDPTNGTLIMMTIALDSSRTAVEVLGDYAAEETDFGFTKTHIPIKLAIYESEQLVSRSQARRILARFESFKEVFLDFDGVSTIGQAFSDEIFRVYRKQHAEVRILWINTTEDVERMIKRTIAAEAVT